MATNNTTVAHAWAHNLDKYHYGHNLWHENGKLMSYHTCIGQRISVNDKIVFIIDRNRYSSSTSKHQAFMFQAIPFKEDNVHVFEVPAIQHSRLRFVWTLCKEDMKKDFIRVGMQFLAADFLACMQIAESAKPEHDFDRHNFQQMLRLFEVTKCTTAKQLLKMSSQAFSNLANGGMYDIDTTYQQWPFAQKHMKKFLKMCIENKETPEIVDAINGKWTWEAYLERTKGLRVAAKNRRLTEFCAYGEHFFRTSCCNAINGQITQKDIKKHTKDGDLIQWLVGIRRENLAKLEEYKEKRDRNDRVFKAKRRLEKYCGMQGFSARYGCLNAKPSFTNFSYNGVLINFSGTRCYEERYLSDSEYREFVECSDKEAWVRAKRQWMLERLQDDKRKFDDFEAHQKENARYALLESQHYQELAGKTEYIAEQKALGSEGYRRLYHEGFKVQLPYNSTDLYDGGNVLLRFNPIRNVVETSKGIKIKVDECKRLWEIFQRWHQNHECEKGFGISTTMSEFKVHSFNNNVLVAGCHQIAFSEMQYIANQLNF